MWTRIERGTRTLTKRLGLDGRERCRRSVAVLLSAGEAVCEGLKGVEANLPPGLGLDEYPIVVPTRQDLVREVDDDIDIRFERWGACRGRQQVGQVPGIPEINGDIVWSPISFEVAKTLARARGLNLARADLEARRRVVFGDGGPECPGRLAAADRSAVQRQECQQTLGTVRDQDADAILLEPETSQHGDTKMRPSLFRVRACHWKPSPSVAGFRCPSPRASTPEPMQVQGSCKAMVGELVPCTPHPRTAHRPDRVVFWFAWPTPTARAPRCPRKEQAPRPGCTCAGAQRRLWSAPPSSLVRPPHVTASANTATTRR